MPSNIFIFLQTENNSWFLPPLWFVDLIYGNGSQKTAQKHPSAQIIMNALSQQHVWWKALLPCLLTTDLEISLPGRASILIWLQRNIICQITRLHWKVRMRLKMTKNLQILVYLRLVLHIFISIFRRCLPHPFIFVLPQS